MNVKVPLYLVGGGYKLYNLGSSDKSREPRAEQTDIACTILARDYKGLSNYGSNGVIEIYAKTSSSNAGKR